MSRQAFVYCRISEDRAGAGLGVARQEADCRDLAERLGWTVAHVYADNDVSAYSGKPRPGYRAMLDALEAGQATAVLVWHTDRLHRSPVELEDYVTVCERRGIVTHTVQAGPLDLSTPSGRLVARQLGSVARYEVEHLVERIKRARAQAVAEGRWTGGRRPYGYRADGVTVEPDEAARIAEATSDVLAGVSLAAIARRWNDAGHLTSTGNRWSASAVRRVLTRPRNAGLMAHNGTVTGKAEWPAVVDEDRWRAVCGILSDGGRRTNLGAPPRHLLSGLALCGICGATLHSSTTAKGRRGYECSASTGHVFRDGTALDAYVGGLIVERLRQPDADVLTAPSTPDTSALHLDAEALRGRLTELAALYADGAVDARQLTEGTGKLRERLAEVERKIGQATAGATLSVFDRANPAAVWDALDVDRRRAVVDTLLTVTVGRARRGRPPGWRPGEPYFDPHGIDVTWKGDPDG